MTLFFVDSRQEIKVGVGLNFPVAPLSKSEIQIDQDVASQLGVQLGDTVSFIVDFGKFLPGLDVEALFALMTLGADFVQVDFNARALVFDGNLSIPFW